MPRILTTCTIHEPDKEVFVDVGLGTTSAIRSCRAKISAGAAAGATLTSWLSAQRRCNGPQFDLFGRLATQKVADSAEKLDNLFVQPEDLGVIPVDRSTFIADQLRWKNAIIIYHELDPRNKGYIDIGEAVDHIRTLKCLNGVSPQHIERLVCILEDLKYLVSSRGVVEKDAAIHAVYRFVQDSGLSCHTYSALRGSCKSLVANFRQISSSRLGATPFYMGQHIPWGLKQQIVDNHEWRRRGEYPDETWDVPSEKLLRPWVKTIAETDQNIHARPLAAWGPIEAPLNVHGTISKLRKERRVDALKREEEEKARKECSFKPNMSKIDRSGKENVRVKTIYKRHVNDCLIKDTNIDGPLDPSSEVKIFCPTTVRFAKEECRRGCDCELCACEAVTAEHKRPKKSKRKNHHGRNRPSTKEQQYLPGRKSMKTKNDQGEILSRQTTQEKTFEGEGGKTILKDNNSIVSHDAGSDAGSDSSDGNVQSIGPTSSFMKLKAKQGQTLSSPDSPEGQRKNVWDDPQHFVLHVGEPPPQKAAPWEYTLRGNWENIIGPGKDISADQAEYDRKRLVFDKFSAKVPNKGVAPVTGPFKRGLYVSEEYFGYTPKMAFQPRKGRKGEKISEDRKDRNMCEFSRPYIVAGHLYPDTQVGTKSSTSFGYACHRAPCTLMTQNHSIRKLPKKKRGVEIHGVRASPETGAKQFKECKVDPLLLPQVAAEDVKRKQANPRSAYGDFTSGMKHSSRGFSEWVHHLRHGYLAYPADKLQPRQKNQPGSLQFPRGPIRL